MSIHIRVIPLSQSTLLNSKFQSQFKNPLRSILSHYPQTKYKISTLFFLLLLWTPRAHSYPSHPKQKKSSKASLCFSFTRIHNNRGRKNKTNRTHALSVTPLFPVRLLLVNTTQSPNFASTSSPLWQICKCPLFHAINHYQPHVLVARQSSTSTDSSLRNSRQQPRATSLFTQHHPSSSLAHALKRRCR